MSKGILDLLRADGCITVNKRLIRALGTIEALIYSELASRHCYFRDRNRLNNSGYFYNTIEDLEHGTGVTRRYQATAIKKLVKLGLIETKTMGIPATRHFRFTDKNIKAVMAIFSGEPEKLPEEKLIEAFKQAGATEEPTEDILQQARAAIEEGKAVVRARERWA